MPPRTGKPGPPLDAPIGRRDKAATGRRNRGFAERETWMRPGVPPVGAIEAEPKDTESRTVATPGGSDPRAAANSATSQWATSAVSGDSPAKTPSKERPNALWVCKETTGVQSLV